MAKVSENKIWRIIARIDDEIIVKQASSIEKVTRSARNAVCQRLCDSAQIEYELGWWKGYRHCDRRNFVDNFIGKALYLFVDEDVEVELHDVPYEVYTIQQVQMTFKKMILMSPDNIDSWGYLHWGPEDSDKFLLLGSKLPIPAHLSSSKEFEEEEVLALCDAQECLDKCPSCDGEIPFGTIILITGNFKLIPTNCCGKMIWLRHDDSENKNKWV